MLIAINKEHKVSPITAVLIQEHQLPKNERGRHQRIAKGLNLLFIPAYGVRAANGVTYGGTAIIIPNSSIERATPNEDIDTARARVAASKRVGLAGRLTTAMLAVEGRKIKLVSAYAPARASAPDGKRTDFFEALRPHITRRTILCIDANCVPDPRLDLQRAAVSAYENEGARTLEHATESKDLIDIARRQLGELPFFTSDHIVAGGRRCKARLDRIYVPDDPRVAYSHSMCNDFFPHPEKRAEYDHAAIHVTACTPPQERGNDLPRIDEKIFDDGAFVGRLHSTILGIYQKHDYTSGPLSDTWERIKDECKRMCIGETRRRKYKVSVEIKFKKGILKAMRRNLLSGRTADVQAADDLESDIRSLAREQRTAFETLEEQDYSYGKAHDTCSAEFFRRWDPRSASQNPATVRGADWSDPSKPTFDGTHENTPEGVLKEFTKYYTSLFSKKVTSPEARRAALDTLRDPNSRRVLPPTAARCDATILREDLEPILQNLPLGKSPGPDRLPNALYRVLSAPLAGILAEVYNEAHTRGCLPPTCTQGLISVLYKKKERDDPRNYRPITLLNGDYKIFTRLLTRRMNEAVVQFVSPEQNGFVPGGFIGENTMLLRLIQAYVEDEDSDAAFLFLDMEKAFDRCSWEYLHEALDAIGFNQGFIDYIKLFYSHGDIAPTRQININGRLGPSFALGSGVAQGCPVSPLLFLVITEALTRLIAQDTTIEGVKIGETRHKISQYADDSTLIGRPHDFPKFQLHINTWCQATAMCENATKREGLLLGRLNRQRTRAPLGIMPDDKWQPNGKSIRCLGVPFGNKVDESAWWETKLGDVRARIAAWTSMSHVSLAGRNLLVQAILYGSVRFWFFSLVTPEFVIDELQNDAYHLLWSTDPTVSADPDTQQTRARARAYVVLPASFRPQRDGGGGVMSMRAHVHAFHAQWIRRYLEPGDPPWKLVVDHWINAASPISRGGILANYEDPDMATAIPQTARYLRGCFTAFASIGLQQDTSKTEHILAEPVFFNWRFDVDVPDDAAAKWSKYIGLKRILNAIDDDTGDIFDDEEMSDYAYTHAPDSLQGTPAVNDFADDIMKTWPEVKRAIPQEAIAAAQSNTELEHGGVVYLEPDARPSLYARVERQGDVAIFYKLFIDTHGTPHETGEKVPDWLVARSAIMSAVMWTRLRQEERVGTGGDSDEEITSLHVYAPTNLAFPAPSGWHPRTQRNDVPDKYKITCLNQLTIKRLTFHFTQPLIGGKRPNCEAAWNERCGLRSPIPFHLVWPSLGTPLSDATEENAWRKLLHRGIFVRNRDPHLPSHNCRLGCGRIESMRHTVNCPKMKPFWDAIFKFISTVMRESAPPLREKAIIFNEWKRNELAPPSACALIRHAYGQMYRDFTLVDTQSRPFNWKIIFARTLRRFRSAVHPDTQ